MSNTGFGRGQGRDWGGRHKENPTDAPKVTRQQVMDFAKSIGVEVKRYGQGTWMRKVGDTWYTCGQTNYLALKHLTQYALDGASALSAEQNTNSESVTASQADTQPRK